MEIRHDELEIFYLLSPINKKFISSFSRRQEEAPTTGKIPPGLGKSGQRAHRRRRAAAGLQERRSLKRVAGA